MTDGRRAALSRDEFLQWLMREGSSRYHDRHPYHTLMHRGELSADQLRQWVLNRYYYQTRIPVKDALIVSKSEDPQFRRLWLRRVQDHDGRNPGEGGLESWLRLARGVGLDVDEVRSCRSVLPEVRGACDSYVEFVRRATLLEAVASSLTELFAPDLMQRRVEAWQQHYPWVSAESLEYFRARMSHAAQDSKEGVEFVVTQATTYDLQQRCVLALITKADILWSMLDGVYQVYVGRDPSRRDHALGQGREHGWNDVETTA
ncbi:Pyrroloquinoline-quinone synthase [Nitrospira sp. KM1]|uniref:pyrroloquinoline-quinone synthase PqqC n=1 Tax=Nitrospira sp. KM1 TaxID=1936990 RepID=UPI0013A7A266|nr:pyrroloquinoline-quinone synthase PqqC [Nitrospira sp. KM1]BCA55254.1 Pyrroloquinoline-quinone synthase [Nitrospira sp. KM1]